MYHYTDSGLSNVWLRNGFTVRETSYGNAVSIHDLEGLHKAIGHHLVNNVTHLDGEEVRFLRKELDLTQSQLAGTLGVSEPTIRGWESDRRPITKSAEMYLRVLYVTYIENEDGKIREVIDRIGQLNRELHHRDIELETTDTGWLAAA